MFVSKIHFFYNHNNNRWARQHKQFYQIFTFFMLETTSRQNKILLFRTKIRLPDGRFVFVVFFFNQNVWLIKFSMDSHKTGNQHSDCMEYLEWVVKKKYFWEILHRDKKNENLEFVSSFTGWLYIEKHMKLTLWTLWEVSYLLNWDDQNEC